MVGEVKVKIMVTGATGQLGSAVIRETERRGHEAVVFPRGLDITDQASVMRRMEEEKPETLIHCAAWTAVDLAELPENRERVYAVNVEGTRNLAKACKKIDCKMIYISTDYVFDGQGEIPWKPDDELCKPLNVYGKSKLEGERALREVLTRYFIVRTSWVFGENGNHFVKAMLKVGKKQAEVTVVDDQIGRPTYTSDLAQLLLDMAESEAYGCYHASNEGGFISWADFAKEIFAQVGYGVRVIPVSTEEYKKSQAVRPLNSRLETEKLAKQGFRLLPPWKDALRRYLQQTGEASGIEN